MILPPPGPTPTGHIRLTYIPKPEGLLGPDARRTSSWVYGIWNPAGSKLMGGSNGPDLDDATARARRFAAEKGVTNPAVEIVSPTGRVRRIRPRP